MSWQFAVGFPWSALHPKKGELTPKEEEALKTLERRMREACISVQTPSPPSGVSQPELPAAEPDPIANPSLISSPDPARAPRG